MRATLIMTAGLMAAAIAGAQAEEARSPGLFGNDASIAAEDLDAKRGGTETVVYGSVVQTDKTDQSATNSASPITVANGGRMSTGDVQASQITGNHGITAVMQNTGNLVNMNNATSVNVYMR